VGVLTAAVLAMVVALGEPGLGLAVAVAVLLGPAWLLAGIGGWALWHHAARNRGEGGPDDEAAFLRSVSSELQAGAALRLAVASGASGSSLDLAPLVAASSAGLSADRVAAELERGLPINGRMAAGAFELAARSGGPAARVMHSLAMRAERIGELERERHALTAQARASAWVIAGLPLAVLLFVIASGRLSTGSDPILLGLVAVGVGLQVVGLAVVARMIRGASG
jgi:tight adherence protein B